MRLSVPQRRREIESTLPFINIVFIILIFLLAAGTLAEVDVRSIDPVVSREASLGAHPENAIVLYADGSIRWQGRPYDLASLDEALRWEAGPADRGIPTRVYADRDASAIDAVAVVATLRANGATDVALVTVRATGQ